jgi:arylsulfatase A-like enzyme
VLYLLTDDMRPDVLPFGSSFMTTPGLSKLANAGTSFLHAYCNIAVCSPSRMSFLTGRYPSNTRTWNFLNHFRQATCEERVGVAYRGQALASRFVIDGGAGQCCTWCSSQPSCIYWTLGPRGNCSMYASSSGSVSAPDSISGGVASTNMQRWTSLPQFFKNAGYLTMGTGKVFHTEEGGASPPWDAPGSGMPPLQDPPSWTPGNNSMTNVNALAPMRGCDSTATPDSCSVKAASRAGDVPAGVFSFEDRTIAEDAIAKLQAGAAHRQESGDPFFLAVGFRKPHLPFRHPAPWDSAYPAPADIPLAKYKVLDPSVPSIAFHTTSIATSPWTPIPDAEAGTYRRDYYAAISWMDSQLMRVLAELDTLGLTNDTVIVWHADRERPPRD